MCQVCLFFMVMLLRENPTSALPKLDSPNHFY
jgi:hypothetical protein